MEAAGWDASPSAGKLGALGNAGAFGMKVGGGAAGGIAALGVAGAAAIGSWMLAMHEADQLEKETGLTMGQSIQHLRGIGGGLWNLFQAGDRMQNFDAVMRRFKETAQDVSTTSGAELQKFAAQIEKLGQAAVA